MDPLRYIDENKKELIDTYHLLHSLAEPSWEEYIKRASNRLHTILDALLVPI